ncbi:MAG: hypothetical protein OQK45_07700 [Sulfurovum sp.]|nr:hypothetical protein [Sulfurovum sp.]
MKILINFKITFMLFVMLFTLNLEANPVLARQYGMECSACHSQVPALNDMGLGFLRNGFRNSTYDTTSLQSLLDSNSSNRRYPVGAIIGLSDNSKTDEVNRLVKLYLAGTITDSLSLYSLTKESFNSNKHGQDLFESDNSQFYFQYNISEAKHVFRAGLLSPLTQLGNVQRSMGHSGLHGTEGHGDHYISPLDHADIRKIKGAEYSYLFDNNILLLFSYGEQVDKHGDHGNIIDDENNNVFLTSLTYKTSENYKIGLIYNSIDVKGNDFYSFIIPMEKEYSLLTWNSSLVYTNASDDDYIGLESAFTFPVGDMGHIKAIVNVDRDENEDTNFGYSLGYTKIYKMFFFEAVASRVNTELYSSNKATGAINIIF